MAEIKAMEIPDASTEPQAYKEALLAVIGDRDPLAVMAETPGRVRALVGDRGPSELERRPAGGEGAAAGGIGHPGGAAIGPGFPGGPSLTEEQAAHPGHPRQ